MSTTFDDMIEFLDLTWPVKDEIVPCLIGPPGIGKTDAVYQHAKNVGAKNVVTIIASQILPNEVSGITMPDERTRSMEIYDHYRLSSLEDGDILFFDELLEADQSTLSACLTLIESRMMMSGKLLPDIQIIAATNPTIQPMTLKLNIRQRFMFKQFDLDTMGTRIYLKKRFGVDLNSYVVGALRDKDDEHYNVLTPRSLTKVCSWMDKVEDDHQLDLVESTVNEMFNSTVGSYIADAFRYKRQNPEQKAKYRLARELLANGYSSIDIDGTSKTIGTEVDVFKDVTMEDLIGVITNLPEWDEIKETLSHIDLDGNQMPKH